MAKKWTSSEEYIIDVSPEISIGEAVGWVQKMSNIFPAFQSRNYRLYFIGQLISLIGTWLQIVAQGWLVLQLTNSSLLIGIVAACATVPSLLFSLFGGVIVDRFDKRRILVITQTSSMVLALILGGLAITGIINIWEIAILAFLLGTVTAVDAPARQSFVVEMVGKENMSSAISLNSGIFNSARVIGPGVAGFLIAWVGSGGAFILNGLSYIAVITAMLMMKLSPMVRRTHPHPLRAIQEGLAYTARHSVIRLLLISAAVTSVFGWSYTTIMPVIAKNTFHLGASGLGYLYAASGTGALVSVVLISLYSKRVNPMLFILGGSILFSTGIIIFSLSDNLMVALPFLFLSGMGLLSQFSMVNATIQRLVEDQYRGRVMSLYTLMFMGFAPLGSLEVGFLSEHFGTGNAIRMGALVTLGFGLVLWRNRRQLDQPSPQ